MRLIATFENQDLGRLFSAFLSQKKIANHYEEGGKVWVYDEDQVPEAFRWLELFEKNPHDPQFVVAPAITPLFKEDPDKIIPLPKNVGREESYPLTMAVIFLCSLLFVWSQFTAPQIFRIPQNLPPAPITASYLYKEFLYDYPKAYELVDKLVSTYGIEQVQNPDSLPESGKSLYLKILDTKYWEGYYTKILEYFHTSSEGWQWNEPMFEKIREGQFWRLISPVFLHSDIFHIFFNMIWVFVLGKEMEPKLGAWRLFLFMLITGIFSNTAQYFMSGPNFIGFSGIICAMLAFIWMRQKIAPWEGYTIQNATMNLMAFFILALVALQTTSFISELFFNFSIGVPIANTAHLSGAFLGFILGKSKSFAWK